MRRAHVQLALGMASTLLGCAAGVERSEADDVAVARAALSVCDETVPENRFIDGIPSYAQCAETQSTAAGHGRRSPSCRHARWNSFSSIALSGEP